MDRIAEQIKRGLAMDGLDSIVASGEVGGGLWRARREEDGIDDQMRVLKAGIRLPVTAISGRFVVSMGVDWGRGRRRENTLLTN